MINTKNTLSQKVRSQGIAVLQERLSESIDLMAQAKQAHWNVKGGSFIALHKLFDEVAEQAEGFVDIIAERIVQLGGFAEGTVKLVAARSTLPEYPVHISSSADHVHALSRSLAFYGTAVRDAIKRVSEISDPATVDILTEVLREVDKSLWFVESQLHGSAESDSVAAPSRFKDGSLYNQQQVS